MAASQLALGNCLHINRRVIDVQGIFVASRMAHPLFLLFDFGFGNSLVHFNQHTRWDELINRIILIMKYHIITYGCQMEFDCTDL